jgi:CelD/BcsL family acetyltransferase involved in cellulose biosynthesis
VRVNAIDRVGDLNRLAPQWNQLLSESAANGPFLTAEWLHAWWTHLGRHRKLQVLTVLDGHDLIAIAPFWLSRGPIGMFSRFEFLGTGCAGSDYLDVIVRRGRERDALEALTASLAARKCALRLNHLPPTSFGSRLAASLASGGWTSKTTAAGVCPFIPLAGHTWDTYLATLGAAHRANVRRRLRALAQAFDVRFELVASEADRAAALQALVGFHEERFGRRGTTFLTGALQAFHADVTRRMLASGSLRLYALRLNGAIAAVMYGFASPHRFYFYQHGFDARYGSSSLGLVLMARTIEAAIEEGAAEFDMLWGTEQYKSLWARDERPLYQVQLYPPHFAGLLQRRTVEAERSMRTVARRILSIGGARAT